MTASDPSLLAGLRDEKIAARTHIDNVISIAKGGGILDFAVSSVGMDTDQKNLFHLRSRGQIR